MQIELSTVRISKLAKNQLITLKRKTGIKTWNVLCRWALCKSLHDPGAPLPQREQYKDGIEIEWHTLAGELAPFLEAAILDRCVQDRIDIRPPEVNRQLRLHIHRGIGQLAGDSSLRSIEDFIGVALPESS